MNRYLGSVTQFLKKMFSNRSNVITTWAFLLLVNFFFEKVACCITFLICLLFVLLIADIPLWIVTKKNRIKLIILTWNGENSNMIPKNATFIKLENFSKLVTQFLFGGSLSCLYFDEILHACSALPAWTLLVKLKWTKWLFCWQNLTIFR